MKLETACLALSMITIVIVVNELFYWVVGIELYFMKGSRDDGVAVYIH